MWIAIPENLDTLDHKNSYKFFKGLNLAIVTKALTLRGLINKYFDYNLILCEFKWLIRLCLFLSWRPAADSLAVSSAGYWPTGYNIS